MRIQTICVVEKADGEYLAYCDELYVTASGATEEEALENLKRGIRQSLAYADRRELLRVLLRPGQKRILLEVEVP